MAVPDRYVTVPEVARTLGCSPETIRRLIRQDKLPAIQIGRCYRLPMRDVVDALAPKNNKGARRSTGQHVA